MKPGRELDDLVAEKVMGWVRLDEHPAPERLMHPDIGKPGNPRYSGPWLYHPNHTYEKGGHMNGQAAPKFSTDIAAAWEVVEKLKAADCDFTLELTAKSDKNKWIVVFDNGGVRVAAQSFESPAHAICLAALEAVGFSPEK